MKGRVSQCVLLAYACPAFRLRGKQRTFVQEQRWTSAGGLETVSGALTASHKPHVQRHRSSPGKRAASAVSMRPPRLSLAYVSELSHVPQGGNVMRFAQSARQPSR